MNSKTTKQIWQSPWSYNEGFLIAIGIFIIGLALEVATKGHGVHLISFPHNAIFGGALAAFIIAASIIYKRSNWVRWLGSTPAAISSIVVFSVLVLLIGFIPQVDEHGSLMHILGLTHITTSWYFVLIQVNLLLTLGFVTTKRILPFSVNNLGFFLNHFGLWLTIVSAGLGSGDLQRLMMQLEEDKQVWYAYDENKTMYELPLAIKLKSFNIEEYAPKLVIIETKTGKILNDDEDSYPLLEEGEELTLKGWSIDVLRHLPMAQRFDKRYESNNIEGSAPAVLISATKDDIVLNGWMTCGSFSMMPDILPIDSNIAFAMTVPEPKKYSSDVEIISKDENKYRTVIEVNKPYKINGWKIYQVSYDESKGRWSKISVVELVRDPWLPFVYTGVFLMLFGALFMFWWGNKKKA